MKDISTTIATIMMVTLIIIKVFFIIVWAWAVISLIDVSIHNLTMNYMYSEWNMFEVFLHINKQSVVSSFILYYFLLFKKDFL